MQCLSGESYLESDTTGIRMFVIWDYINSPWSMNLIRSDTVNLTLTVRYITYGRKEIS